MTVFKTSRRISASTEQVFAAFQPERLARWWGPAGFSNTFGICEFKNGGRWSFTMHGPDGKNYPNENIFAEIVAPTKVVVEHASEPKYRLTISIEALGSDTVVHWEQVFASVEVAKHIAPIVVPANEQNLERLSEEVLARIRTM